MSVTNHRGGITEARHILANHWVSKRPTMSWHMARRNQHGGSVSTYAYAVTWTPGTLMLSGDLGEFVVTHWHAMPTIQETMRWLTGIDFQYLMEKSSAKQIYDDLGTARSIIDMANEEARHAAWRTVKEARGYRRDRIEALCEWDAAETRWAVYCGEEPLRPHLVDYLPESMAGSCWGYPGFVGVDGDRRWAEDDGRSWIAPDGFELWGRLFERFSLDINDRGLGRNCLLWAWGRREVKKALRAFLHGCSHQDAAQLCSELGLDDYHGSTSYPPQCYLWFAAIETWRDAVKDQILADAPEAMPA